MNELNLKLGELQLKITLIKREVEERGLPYLDWLICDVAASFSGFSGTFQWSVMPTELDQLANNLSNMHAEFPILGKVDFKSVEPNVVLTFELTKTGQILGHFTLHPILEQDTVLKGSFHIDQTHLPEIVCDIRTCLKSSIDSISLI